MALQSLNQKAIRRMMKRRRKNERMYRRAFQWNTYVQPVLDLVRPIFGRALTGAQ